MAFDGIVAYAMAEELNEALHRGKIEKIYQPEANELLFVIHTKSGNQKLFATTCSSAPRLHLFTRAVQNPSEPSSLCMLFRKHLQNGRILKVEQKDSERIVEIYVETFNELGFNVGKKIVFEIMGKHSNIILVDTVTNKIIDSVKRISFDDSRVRQVLPGKHYEYPPSQDKIGFKAAIADPHFVMPSSKEDILNKVGGVSPAVATSLSQSSKPTEEISEIYKSIVSRSFVPKVYIDKDSIPKDFHIMNLYKQDVLLNNVAFHTMSEALEYYYENKISAGRVGQKRSDLLKVTNNLIQKMELKKKRLTDDLYNAENSDDLRLKGELLTANLHLLKGGEVSVAVFNYYTNDNINISLEPKLSPAQNAQKYYKRFGKSKTAIKEKQLQLSELALELEYIHSVITAINLSSLPEELEDIRKELQDGRYIKKGKVSSKERKQKFEPRKFHLEGGFTVYVGKNNKENDYITFKVASSKDIWFHTKDIPGSHTVLIVGGNVVTEDILLTVAKIAAYYSKGAESENVPVDYTLIKHVKKPQGAKPGMVIFTNNKTLYVTPELPQAITSDALNS